MMNEIEIEARIAAMEVREAELRQKAFGGHVSTHDHNMGDAAVLLKKEIAKLKEQRAKILAGVVEEKPPEPVPSYRRMPRNITSKKMREVAPDAHAAAIKAAVNLPNDTPFDDVAAVYQTDEAFAAFEANFLKMRDMGPGGDELCAYTQNETCCPAWHDVSGVL